MDSKNKMTLTLLIKTLYNLSKQRILQFLQQTYEKLGSRFLRLDYAIFVNEQTEEKRKLWERVGFTHFLLDYLTYGNTIYETRLQKYSDGSIHTIDEYKTLLPQQNNK